MLDLLTELHKPAPRYTSYPTAVDFVEISENSYFSHLSSIQEPLSLYLHIPFCQKICLFCGCSVVLNRKEENERLYTEALVQEIKMVSKITGKKKVVQIHFGGGTPTKLSIELLTKILEALFSSFSLDQAEIAIEIDPRTVFSDQGQKLKALRALGFNRVSFGVQDTNEKVQEAIKRRQSLEMTQKTFYLAKELGFTGINLDLIYGLPYQTITTFAKTCQDIIALRPDRIAFFSYAKVPWIKPHQKAIKDATLPSFEEKFQIYSQARETFLQNGYMAIGMDHFALEQDELAKAYRNKTLQRNFQGYTTTQAQNLIGFGITAIGFVENGYFQNVKTLQEYQSKIQEEHLPVFRGYLLTDDDLFRKTVIHKLMCQFELSKTFEEKRLLPLVKDLEPELELFKKQGLLIETKEKLVVTKLGELFVRNIAFAFDSFANKRKEQNFSKTI